MQFTHFLNTCISSFSGQMGNAPSVVTDTLPAEKEPEGAKAGPASDEEEDEDLMGRLQALRS